MNTVLSKGIIAEWNLGSLPKEKQLETVERISRILYQALLVRSLDILSEGEQAELDTLLDQDSTTPEQVFDFLQKKIPTFEKMVLDERRNLKEDMLIPAQ